MALIRASMCAHLQRRSLLLPARIAAFSCSAPSRSQEDLDRKFSDKTKNRLLEDAPFKAYQQKGGQLEHFAQTESAGELVPSSQQEVKEYTLPLLIPVLPTPPVVVEGVHPVSPPSLILL